MSQTKLDPGMLYGKSMEERIALLKDCYGLNHVKIEGEDKKGFLGFKHVGSLDKVKDGYRITVVEDSDGYLTLHEFLHVWLEETERTFDIFHEDPELEEYLYWLRNTINDYLIETEVKKQFGDAYAGDAQYTRDRDLRGQFLGAGVARSALPILMLGLTCKAVSTVYPQMKESISAQLFGQVISFKGFDNFIETILQYDSSITPEQYQEAVQRLHKAFVCSDLTFEDDGKVNTNPQSVKGLVQEFSRVYDRIQGILRLAMGRK
jgi:hypothetical protein